MPKPKPLFAPGRMLSTPGALEQVSPEVIYDALTRHLSGDWGDLCAEDMEENHIALKEGFRIFSAYEYADEPRFWIITEADRSATTILLPEEY